MKKNLARAFALGLVVALSLPLVVLAPRSALAQPPMPPKGKPAVTTATDVQLNKIDPRIRAAAKVGGEELFLVQVLAMPDAEVEDYFVGKRFSRVQEPPSRPTSAQARAFGGDMKGLTAKGAAPAIKAVTGRVPADALLKLASVEGVVGIMAPGWEPPVPPDPDVPRPKPDLDTIRERLEAAKEAGVGAPKHPNREGAGGIKLTSWYEKTYGGYQEAWDLGFEGDGVKVAVIDTGVDFAHPDLEGAQARITDPASLYYDAGAGLGWPIAFDGRSMADYAFDVRDGRGNWAWYVDTSAIGSDPTISFGGYDYTTPGTSLSGTYHIGWHPDDTLVNWWYGEPLAVLVADEGRFGHAAGVYDTVYVDLNNNKTFADDKPCFLGDEVSWWDFWDSAAGTPGADGYADLSGGMVYFIADGVNPVPASDWLWGLAAPGNGDLVAFMINDVTESGGDHGTLCASAVAGQGIINGDAPAWKPPYAGPGDGMVQGPGKNTKVIGVGNFYAGGFLSDYYLFVLWGYDGAPWFAGIDDEAQIVSISYGSGSTDNDEWDSHSRLITYYNIYGNPFVTFTNSSGNSAPGYGTASPPVASTGVHVGASTQYGSCGTFDSITDIGQIRWGDVQSWSSRGPTAMGGHTPSVTANGAWGSGDLPLNEWGDGWTAWGTWGGTSRSSPVAAGVLSLIYDAYETNFGGWPSYLEARELVMSGANFNNYDPKVGGAGVVDAWRSTLVAGGLYGIVADPSFWEAGDYRGNWYEAFAKILPQGGSDSQTFTLYNLGNTDITVDLSDVYLTEFGTPYVVSFTTADQSVEEGLFTKPDYLFDITGQIPAQTDLMIIRAIHPFEQFDADYVPGDPTTISPSFESRWRLLVYDWTDANTDGNLWTDDNGNGVVDTGEIDSGEYIRYNYGYTNATSQEVRVYNPLGNDYLGEPRHHDGIFVGFRHRTRSASIPTTDITFEVRFYQLLDWPLLDLGTASLLVPAGDSASFEATINVPANQPLGMYEGHILVDDPGDPPDHPAHLTAIPVEVHVSGTPDPVIGGTPWAGTPYDNGYVNGFFDWDGWTSSGDWRFYFLDQEGEPPSGTHLLIHDVWDDAVPTDIDTVVFGPSVDVFSSIDPTLFGPYTLGLVGGSTRTGARPNWLFNTATGTIEEWIGLPLQEGLHLITQHNVLYGGYETAVSFTKTVGTARVSPYPIRLHDCEAGATMPVVFTSKIRIEGGLEGMAFGLSEQLSEMVTFEADGPYWWEKEFEASNAGLIEVTTHDSESTIPDIDLYLDWWDGANWVQVGLSGGATAEEFIKLVLPADGLYKVRVHDYSEVAGEIYLHIRRPQGNALSLVGLPTGTIEPDTPYEFSLYLNETLGGGRWEGSVFVGPAGALTAIEVPVTAVCRPPVPVGGTIVPVSKLELLAPWMGLVAVTGLAALTAVLVRRRRARPAHHARLSSFESRQE